MRSFKASEWAKRSFSLCLFGQAALFAGLALPAVGADDAGELTQQVIQEREEQFAAIAEQLQSARDLAREQKYREADAAYAQVLERLKEIPGDYARRQLERATDEHQSFKSDWARSLMTEARRLYQNEEYVQAQAKANDAGLVDSRITREVNDFTKMCVDVQKNKEFRDTSTLEAANPEYDAIAGEIDVLLRQAQTYFDGGKYEMARTALEKVYVLDPFNEPAIRLLEKTYNKLYHYGAARAKADVQAMQGFLNWNSVVPVLPTQARVSGLPDPISRPVSTTDIMNKMEKIIFPRIEFDKQDIFTAITFLKKLSQAQDPDGVGVQVWALITVEEAKQLPEITMMMQNIPMSEVVRYICQATGLKYRIDNGGVVVGKTVDEMQTETFPIRREVIARISDIDVTAGGLLPNQRSGAVLPTGGDAIPFGGNRPTFGTTTRGGGGGAGAGVGVGTGATMGGNTYAPTGGGYRPPGVGARSSSSSSRSSNRSSSSSNRSSGRGGIGSAETRRGMSGGLGGGTAGTGAGTMGAEAFDPTQVNFAKRLEPVSSETLMRYFNDRGIPFGTGATVAYDLRGNNLVVKNTLENLRKMDNLLRQLNVEVPMVLVEARIVEITETNLERLGFNWVLSVAAAGSDHPGWGINDLGGATDLGNNDPLRGNEEDTMILSGLKIFPNFGESLFGAGSNVDLSLSISALSQHSTAEVLTSPRILTASGTEASLEMFEKRYLPVDWEYDDDDDDDSDSNNNNNWGSNVIQIDIPTPVFEDEGTDLGVNFAVRPVVGPDNYTITLDLYLNIFSYIGDWTYTYSQKVFLIRPVDDDETAFIAQELIGVDTNIWMPIYGERDMTVKVKVYDGETIVLGGMIDSRSTTVNDKWPILGDLPLIGRLFQANSENSEKTNLLVFVTARLINNDGIPLRSEHARTGRPSFPY